MKTLKKSLAVLLAVLMLASVFAVAANAEVIPGGSNFYITGSKEISGGVKDWPNDETSKNMVLGAGAYFADYDEEIPTGTYEFKIIQIDGTNKTWYGDGDGHIASTEASGNFLIEVKEATPFSIAFNSETGEVYFTDPTSDGAKSTKVGFAGAIDIEALRIAGGMNSWNTSDDNFKLEETSAGVYSGTFDNLANQSFNFKFVANGDWKYGNWGAGEGNEAAYGGSDISVDVPLDATAVTFTLDLSAYDADAKTGATYSIDFSYDDPEPTTEEDTSIDPPAPQDDTDPQTTTEPQESTAAQDETETQGLTNPDGTPYTDPEANPTSYTTGAASEETMLTTDAPAETDPEVTETAEATETKATETAEVTETMATEADTEGDTEEEDDETYPYVPDERDETSPEDVADGYTRIDITSNILPVSSQTYKTDLQDTVRIEFKLNTAISVLDSQGVLSYSGTDLELVSFELPNLANPVINTELPDRVNFNSSTAKGSTAFTDGAVLAVAEFKLLSEGATTVDLDIQELNGDEDGEDVAIITDGIVVNNDCIFSLELSEPAVPTDATTEPATTEPATSATEATQATTVAPTTAAPTVAPAKAALNATSKSLKAGKTFKLKVTGTTAKATFKSSKASIVKVTKNGKLTALKKGSATITVKVAGQVLKCKVKVTTNPKIKVAGKKFSAKKTYSVNKGKTLKVKVTGKAASIKNKFIVNKKNGLKVSGAKTVKIKAKKKGTYKVTIKVNKNTKFRIKVKVK